MARLTVYPSKMLCLQDLYTPLKTSMGLSDLSTRSSSRADEFTGLPNNQMAPGRTHRAVPHLKACKAQKTKAVSEAQGRQLNACRPQHQHLRSCSLSFLALSVIFLIVLPTKLNLPQYPLLPFYSSLLTALLISASARVSMG